MNTFLKMLWVTAMLFGLLLPPGWLVSHFLPTSDSKYSAGFVTGFWALKVLLLGGGLFVFFFSRKLGHIFSTEKESISSGPPGLTSSDLLFLAALTLCAAVIRIAGLDRSLTFDEVFLVRSLITQDPIRILFHPSGSSHALHSLLASGSASLLGASEWSVRLPAMVFGALTPGLLYLLLRRVSSLSTAVIASILICFTPIHVWFSQEAKGNSLLVFFVVASWLALAGLSTRWRGWVAAAYCACLFLVGISHLSGIMFVVCQALVFLLPAGWRPVGQNEGRGSGVRILVLHAIALWALALFYAPVGSFLGASGSAGRVREKAAELLPLVWDIGRQFTALDMPGITAIPALLLAVLGACVIYRRSKGLFVLLLLPFLVDMVLTVVLQLFSYPRYHMFVLPALVLLAASGAAYLLQLAYTSRAAVCALACLLLVTAAAIMTVGYSGSLSTYYRMPKSNYKAVADHIKGLPEGTVVYVAGRDKLGYPASGLMFYTQSFETDSTVRDVLASRSNDFVEVVFLDDISIRTGNPSFESAVRRNGDLVSRYTCLSELDQYRARSSFVYRLPREELVSLLGTK